MIPIVRTHPERLARIGYSSLLISTTQAPKALIPNTFERYQPIAGAVVAKFQLSASTPIDYIAIGAHNVGTHDSGTPLLIQYATTVGGALIDIESITPTDNGAIMLLFDSVTVAEIAITTNAATLGLEIGLVYAGIAMQMQQPIYGGVSPIDLSAKTEYESTMSDSGQFLGRNITKKGTAGSYSWKHLEDDWMRETFKPFIDSAKQRPFFFKWRPDLYNATVLAHTTADIRPTNMGGGSKLMTVSIEIMGHDDV
jgi:hypothetical protein